MASGLVQLHTKSRVQAKCPVKVESCPPSRFDGSPGPIDRFVDRVLDWLGTGSERTLRREASSGWEPVASHAATPLAIVRIEFVDALEDIPTLTADQLDVRIRHARSLRELWHLRADIYGLVGLQHGQIEAERRLGRLNRHFPARVPRSMRSCCRCCPTRPGCRTTATSGRPTATPPWRRVASTRRPTVFCGRPPSGVATIRTDVTR